MDSEDLQEMFEMWLSDRIDEGFTDFKFDDVLIYNPRLVCMK